MQFQVPQFIEREARVVGPLTFRQFLYVGSAGAVAFVMYFTLPLTLFVAGTILVVGIGVALAFFSVGGKSLSALLLGFLAFSIGTKTYVWKKGRISRVISGPASEDPFLERTAEQLSLTRESKMKNLATKLDSR